MLVAAASSGCAASDGASKVAPSTIPPAPPPTANADTGSIAGLVVDDEMAPVREAVLALLPEKVETKSDASGAFTFNDVQPGAHTVLASRLGYHEAQVRVTVNAGEITQAKVTLQAIEVAGDPYHQIFPATFYMVFGISDVHRANAFRDIACQPCEVWLRHPLKTTDGLFEALWAKSVPAPVLNEKFSFSVRANAMNGTLIPTGEAVWTGTLTSGQSYRFTEGQAETLGKSKVTLVFANVPPDTPALHQRINVWLSVAWNGQLPANHTAMPPR